MRVLDSIRHNIEQHKMLAPGDRVVVAVSGGQDSLCLLHVLKLLAGEMRLELHVAHLNHGLRGADSDADAAFVQQTAAEWGIAATVASGDVLTYRKERRLSLEDAARRVRYAFLQRVAAGVGAAAIATGHTSDDQVETIIMHWLRGAGAGGLLGMLPVQPLASGVRLIRPLLDATRAETGSYCRENRLAPRYDLSNDDRAIPRNYVRHSVLPALDKVATAARANILRAARILADEDVYMQQQVDAAWQALAREEEGVVSIERAGLQALPVALQRRLLRQAWQLVTGSYDDLSWLHIERAMEVMDGPVGGEMSLPHDMRVQRGYTAVTLCSKDRVASSDLPLLATESIALAVPGVTALPQSNWSVHTEIVQRTAGQDFWRRQQQLCESFDTGVVGRALCLRRWQAGDRMQPLGMVGEKKVHDIMTDDRVPRSLRHSIPLLATAGCILWVAGSRRSDVGRVTSATMEIVTVWFEHGGASD